MSIENHRKMELKSKTELLTDPTPIWKRRRYFVVFMAFLGYFNIYTMRSNLSVAIVSMTNNESVINEDGSETFEQLFPWSSVEKGYVLSSFFYGYVITQFIGGLLTRKIGGNILFGTGIWCTSFFTLLGPVSANLSLYALIATRVLIGFFEGITIPAIYQIWTTWAPPNERSRIVAASMAGCYFGIVTSMPLSGVLISTIGWEWAFYVFGIFGFIWSILWLIFIRNTPAEDRYISNEEREFIQKSLDLVEKNVDRNMKIPWLALWTSTPFWAVIILCICAGWGTFTIQTQLPQFLNDVLDFNINKSGIMTALPYLCLAFMLQVAGSLTDYVILKGYLTKLQTRRYFNCSTFLFEVVCLFCAAFFIHPAISMTLITIAVAMTAFIYANNTPNLFDIAPSFAGITVAITNTSGTISGLVSPLVTGYIVTDGTDAQWKIIFYITAALYLIGGIVYWMWASAEIQPWAKSSDIDYVKSNESKQND